MTDVMIDLETLSLRPDAFILEIGAVAFEPKHGGDIHIPTAFDQYINGEGQMDRHIDLSTLVWWLDDENGAGIFARQRLAQGMKKARGLGNVLHDFTTWILQIAPEKVWARGSSFDLAILRDAFMRYTEALPPWSHRAERDSRTLYDVRGYKDKDDSYQEWAAEKLLGRSCIAHAAVDDCVVEILRVQSVTY